jgi:hypothetical protein
MEHSNNNDTIFRFQGYLVNFSYDDYTTFTLYYNTTKLNEYDLKEKVKTELTELKNCEPFYYIDATEIYEIIDDNYFKFSQSDYGDSNTLQLPIHYLKGESFHFTIPTPQENIPTNVILVNKIHQHLPSLLTPNKITDEETVESMIDILKQLLPDSQKITTQRTYREFGEVSKNSFNIEEAIQFVEDKQQLPLFITSKDYYCGVILSMSLYKHMEKCANIVEDTQIYESIKDRLDNHNKEN